MVRGNGAAGSDDDTVGTFTEHCAPDIIFSSIKYVICACYLCTLDSEKTHSLACVQRRPPSPSHYASPYLLRCIFHCASNILNYSTAVHVFNLNISLSILLIYHPLYLIRSHSVNIHFSSLTSFSTLSRAHSNNPAAKHVFRSPLQLDANSFGGTFFPNASQPKQQ